MTPAQAAQNQNRTESGQYKTKTHSEAEVSLTAGFESSYDAAQAVTAAVPEWMEGDYEVREAGYGAQIVSEWDPEADPSFEVTPADSASYRIAPSDARMDAPRVSLRRSGETEATAIWDAQNPPAQHFTDPADGAAFIQRTLAASIASRMLHDGDPDQAARLAAALEAKVATPIDSHEPEESSVDWGREDGDEMVYRMTDQQIVVDDDGQEQIYDLHTVAYARTDEDYELEDEDDEAPRRIRLHTYSDDENGIQEINPGVQIASFSGHESDREIAQAAQAERSRLSAGGMLPGVQDSQDVFVARLNRDDSVDIRQGGFID